MTTTSGAQPGPDAVKLAGMSRPSLRLFNGEELAKMAWLQADRYAKG
jgi:hypothetical protein